MTPVRPGRVEDRHLVAGQGRFTADRRLPGERHAHAVRSDRAHAAIDMSVAWAAAGTAAVLTRGEVAAAGSARNGVDGKPPQPAARRLARQARVPGARGAS